MRFMLDRLSTWNARKNVKKIDFKYLTLKMILLVSFYYHIRNQGIKIQ